MATAKKAAPKKAAAPKKPTATAPAKKVGAPKKENGLIAQIIALHVKGKTNQQIVDAGFNKTTVSIQVAKYKKANEKPTKK